MRYRLGFALLVAAVTVTADAWAQESGVPYARRNVYTGICHRKCCTPNHSCTVGDRFVTIAERASVCTFENICLNRWESGLAPGQEVVREFSSVTYEPTCLESWFDYWGKRIDPPTPCRPGP